MGTFVNSFYVKGAHIPKEKELEFQERLEKLFQAGGMMEIDQLNYRIYYQLKVNDA
ncbi:MAG: hypothetical protein LIP12_12085 [Clostridiales bacterium]|nr:hypothetical protein [Clostridiales bacterium]